MPSVSTRTPSLTRTRGVGSRRRQHTWRADEGKITRDLAYSAFGRIPLVGDLVANGYTAMERLQTLAVELPADVRAGDIKTSLLDLSLVAWGGVQVVAEVVPGFDNLTDLGETFLQSARDEMARQRAYWQLLAALQRGDHLRAPKYLFLRPLSHDSARPIHSFNAPMRVATRNASHVTSATPTLTRQTVSKCHTAFFSLA